MSASFPGTLEVSAGEHGMKLLRFLERRLSEQVPKAALHKWIRTGQVRVNKGRAKPFSPLAAGDLVRIPPFAPARNVHTPDLSALPDFPALPEPSDILTSPGIPSAPGTSPVPAIPPAPGMSVNLGPDIRVVGGTGHLLALAKPAGLPCQPGAGHEDSLCARLAEAFSRAPFIPAPAHRVDRHTSGLVLAGMTHAAQRRLHGLFASGGIIKEYLAWVAGDWRRPGPCLLEDRLEKTAAGPGRESMTAQPGGKTTPLPRPGPDAPASLPPGSAGSSRSFLPPGSAGSSRSFLPPGPGGSSRDCLPPAAAGDRGFAASAALAVCGAPEGTPFRATLLLLRLFTGRTHQLRVQLASRGFPIIGDGRYGGPRFSHMLLHAFALSLPAEGLISSAAAQAPFSSAPLPPASFSPAPPGGNGLSGPGRLQFTAPPPWPEAFAPDAALLFAARRRLALALAAPPA